jgi:hypothetical protein
VYGQEDFCCTRLLGVVSSGNQSRRNDMPNSLQGIAFDWNSDQIDEHRRGISDLAWAGMQPYEPQHMVGDVVEFMAGGFGIITKANRGNPTFPTGYSVEWVPGMAHHLKGKVAWHYDGDIRRIVEGSALRRLSKSQPCEKPLSIPITATHS